VIAEPVRPRRAPRSLPGRRYRPEYAGDLKVNVVQATPAALTVAERFGISVSDSARARVGQIPP